MLFVCSPTNELMLSAQRATPTPPHTQRFDSIDQALAAAQSGDSALLVLADAGYPSTLTPITTADYSAAERKGLRVFVEFPAALPPGGSAAFNSSSKPLPMDQICGVSTTGGSTATRLVSVSNATGLAPMRVFQQNQAVALPVQILGPPPPPPAPTPPPGPPHAGCTCPSGFANHTSGYWANPTPNTSSLKPAVSVPACAAKCSADAACLAFEVWKPTSTMQCHTFEGALKSPFTPFTPNEDMCTCVKSNHTSMPTARDRVEPTVYVVGARVAGYDTVRLHGHA
jgi:hypothetical protein